MMDLRTFRTVVKTSITTSLAALAMTLAGCSAQPVSTAPHPNTAENRHAEHCVVLVHGLWRSGTAMRSIDSYLQNNGFSTVSFSYPSTEALIPDLAEQYLLPAVHTCEATGATTVHLVTHSMGGIVARAYLQNHRLPGAGKVVMISPPNHGSEITEKLSHYGWFTSIAGVAAATLTEDGIIKELKPFPEPVGVIAGYRSWSLWPESLLPTPNDGMVSVASMPLEGMDDFVEVEGGHAMLRFKDAVKIQILAFLDHGQFDGEVTPHVAPAAPQDTTASLVTAR